MISPNPHPLALTQPWYYIGPDRRSQGKKFRIVRVTDDEIEAVEESKVPAWAWQGSSEEFLNEFTFVGLGLIDVLAVSQL